MRNLLSLERCFYKAQKLFRKGHKRTANLLAMFYNLLHSCDIPPATRLGEGVTFAHRGIGIVINSKAIIGDNCHIFHGVTIGGRGGKHDNDQPIIGNNVFIGCNASILGGVTIGDNVVIGANAVVLSDVPENATVVGVPAKQIL